MRMSMLFVLALALPACVPVNNDTEETDTEVEDTDTERPTSDLDGDGFSGSSDCDDENAAINPDADERCDNIDNNCDGDVDEQPVDGDLWFEDRDDDGFGDDTAMMACDRPDGYVTNDSDCDDRDGDINPDADESCNGEDDNCDGDIDEGVTGGNTYYRDSDDDGYGDAGRTSTGCTAPSGYVEDDSDCDDTDDAVSPGATEIYCDGAVQRCGGSDGDVVIEARTDLASGLEAASSGDVVCVEAGTYYGPITISVPVTLASIDGAARTIIVGDGRDRVLTIDGAANTVISGFTIKDGGTDENGGGIYVTGANAVSIDECLIQDNSANTGGGIAIDDSSGVSVTNTTVSGNTAEYGGGLAVLTTALDVLIEDNTFSGNTVTQSGGGMIIYDSQRASIVANTFSSNIAPLDEYGSDGQQVWGGGLLLWGAEDATVTDNTFSGNTGFAGGGLCTIGNAGSVIEDNVVTGNQGYYGGGFAVWEAPSSTFSANELSDNYAVAGGGLFVGFSDDSRFEDLDITGNYVDSDGGGVYFYANIGGVMDSNTIESNSAPYGAGGGLVVVPYYGESEATISNNSIAYNSAYWAGGIYISSGIGDTVEGNTIESNYATEFGGGSYWYAPDNCTSRDNTFTSNEAGSAGGGLYLSYADGLFTFDADSFSGNTAPDGDGIYCEDSDYTGSVNMLGGDREEGCG